jgi:hypothetical protein
MGTTLLYTEKQDLEKALGSTEEHQHQNHRPESHSTHDDNVEAPGDDATETVQLPPPPDGGVHAWLKVFGGFLIYINIW